MVDAIGTTYKNSILNALLRAASFTGPATVYAQLHSGDPGSTGTANVIAVTRQPITFGDAALSGQISNTAAIDFVGMPNVTVSYVSLWSGVTGGLLVSKGILGESTLVVLGDTYRLGVGDVQVRLT